MKNKKLFALTLSFLILGNTCQQLKAIPPEITTQQANDAVTKARKTIEDCESLLVFEACDIFRVILLFIDTYAPKIVGELQSGEVTSSTSTALTVGLKKLFNAFSDYAPALAELGRFDTVSVGTVQECFADVYPQVEETTGTYMRQLLGIINNYIPEKDKSGRSDVIFLVGTLTVNRQKCEEELAKLQGEIVEYFNKEYQSMEKVRSIITERSLRNLKYTLNAELDSKDQQKLDKYEKALPLSDKVKTILLNTDEMLQQPTFSGKLWCGIKSFFG